ncbi:hypothetical protein JZ751_028060 [Albula glossodonta]|uniref:Uncharacterized protein n=1 Tax=Albula glossodonta TaxID=121402 RepID=A0A8T2PIZ6_9TELE|nr:hypothetical protein JZ751_028060 [Albula glossodonta]
MNNSSQEKATGKHLCCCFTVLHPRVLQQHWILSLPDQILHNHVQQQDVDPECTVLMPAQLCGPIIRNMPPM